MVFILHFASRNNDSKNKKLVSQNFYSDSGTKSGRKIIKRIKNFQVMDGHES